MQGRSSGGLGEPGQSGSVATARPSAVHLGQPGSLGFLDGGAVTRSWHDVAEQLWLAAIPGWVDPGWFTAPVRREVRALLDLPPGPELLSAVAELDTCIDCPSDHSAELAGWERPAGMPDLGRPGGPCACRIVITAAWGAVASWTEAQQARCLVAAARLEVVRPHPENGRPVVVDPAADEIAGALRTSGDGARNRIAAARAWVEQPELMALIEDGFCGAWTARLMMQDFRYVAAPELSVVIDIVSERVRHRSRSGARPWTGAEIRQCARRVAARHAVDWRATRRRARLDRSVRVVDEEHGMSRLMARIRSADAHRIHRRMTAIARGIMTETDATPAIDDGRTLDQVRSDVLVDLLLGATARDESPRGEQVAVVVDLPTLLGMADNPGDIPGHGPVPPDVAREFAADSNWRMWVTDARSDRVVATSARTYRPTAAVARLVRAREPYCRMPGCRRRSDACDLDHVTPWPRGSTTPQNLGPLCRRHHNLKTHYGWQLANSGQIEGDADGDPVGWRWRSPAGISWSDTSPAALSPES